MHSNSVACCATWLKGEMYHRWAISVTGNWRLTFEFKYGDVYVLDDEDYH